MPETTSSVSAQAATTDTTSAQVATTTSTDAQVADDKETISHEDARKLRSEASNLRKRLKAYEDKEKADQDAQLTEAELAKKQYADLQALHETHVRQTQERIVRYELEKHARQLNIIDADAAAKLLDWSELEFEEDGTPKNAEDLLKKLVKNKPYLSAASATPPANGNRSPALPAMNPGRTNIQAPSAPKPGYIPRFADIYRQKK